MIPVLQNKVKTNLYLTGEKSQTHFSQSVIILKLHFAYNVQN